MEPQAASEKALSLKLHIGEIDALAGLVAGLLRPGVAVALRGDLGAGKSTLARSIVRSVLRDQAVEVASPTFPIVQVYEAADFSIGHFDFYRLGGPDDVEETGYRDILDQGPVLIEWPERAEGVLPCERIEISISETGDPDVRVFALSGMGAALAGAVGRVAQIQAFLARAGWAGARVEKLYGDASSRRYFRLWRGEQRALLMDVPAHTDGPRIFDGKSYGQVAHLAEDVRPFVAVDRALRQAGLSAPELIATDLEGGMLLLEDLGDDVFGALVQNGFDQETLWRAGVETLLHLRTAPCPERLAVDEAEVHDIRQYDRQALGIEVDLLLQWYWPAVRGGRCPDEVRHAFDAAWAVLFDRLLALGQGWVLRDFHSPNLIWLPERDGVARVGVIDFQDALVGHPAYDVVSLLQDARVDVAAGIEARLLAHYVAVAGGREVDFDAADFRFAYSVLGAQRNTKILGIFARLAIRDGKPQYLRHIPRIWSYVTRNLENAALAPLAQWYDAYLPGQYRIWPEERR